MSRDYITGTGQKIYNVHEQDACVPPCVIHAPTPGPWEQWKTHWRGGSIFNLYHGFERICPHGVGHPAVEELARGSSGVHGCDGCPCS